MIGAATVLRWTGYVLGVWLGLALLAILAFCTVALVGACRPLRPYRSLPAIPDTADELLALIGPR